MALFYVMRPDNVESVDPVFTRYGRMGPDVDVARRRAARVKGRVYLTNAHGNELVHDYWTAPKPKSERRPYRAHQRVMAEAALFGALV